MNLSEKRSGSTSNQKTRTSFCRSLSAALIIWFGVFAATNSAPPVKAGGSYKIDRSGVVLLLTNDRYQGSGTFISENTIATAWHVLDHQFAPFAYVNGLFGAKGWVTGPQVCKDEPRDAAVIEIFKHAKSGIYPLGKEWAMGRGYGQRVIVAGYPGEIWTVIDTYVRDINYQGLSVSDNHGGMKPLQAPVYLLRKPSSAPSDLAGISGGPVFSVDEDGTLYLEGIVIAQGPDEIVAVPIVTLARYCLEVLPR